MSTLFGHLAPKFGSKPEDLATEALSYILDRSEVARRAFIQHINDRSNVALEHGLQFSTQGIMENGGIPDLWGRGNDNSQLLLVEAKFWAGLTSRQPSGYLEALADAKDGVLVFLVPEKRTEHITRVVLKALREEDVLDGDARLQALPVVTKMGSTVAITNWSTTLCKLEEALTDAGEHRILADVHQLRGLCERLDAEAFHPLSADELSPNVARRILDLKGLVESLHSVIQQREGDGWVKVGDVRSARLNYVFTVELYGWTVEIGLRYWWWKTRESSPLWVRICLSNQKHHNELVNQLRPEIEVLEGGPGAPLDILVPLPLALGADREEVLARLKNRLHEVAEHLSRVPCAQ